MIVKNVLHIKTHPRSTALRLVLQYLESVRCVDMVFDEEVTSREDQPTAQLHVSLM